MYNQEGQRLVKPRGRDLQSSPTCRPRIVYGPHFPQILPSREDLRGQFTQAVTSKTKALLTPHQDHTQYPLREVDLSCRGKVVQCTVDKGPER